MPMKQNKALNEKCLTCAMCDDSDIPNLFCKLNSELINDGDYRYCPKKPREVINFIEKQDNEIKRLSEELERYRSLGEIKKETHKPPTGKIRVNKELNYTEVSLANKKFFISDIDLIALAELAGLTESIFKVDDSENTKKSRL